jgi:hypothetical protein
MMPRPDYDFHPDDVMDRDRNRDSERMQDRDYRDRDRYRARGTFRDDMAEQASGSRYHHDGNRNRMDDRQRVRDPRYGSDAYSADIAMDETRKLIASNKVEGTPVYDRSGDRCGSIHNFMVDKRQGKVVYAVLKHSGGFLGFNDRYYPLHWDELTYNTKLDGYKVDLDQDELKRRGSFDSNGRWTGGHDYPRDRARYEGNDLDRSERSFSRSRW